jgi:ATP-binding cassette subfamily F protein uup
MRNPNFLILDEPTNDLDILTLSVLEDFLLEFPGCVIIVSHDRYFMDKLVDHLFVFHGEGVIQDFPGNYTQWREQFQRSGYKVPVPESGTPVVKPESSSEPKLRTPNPGLQTEKRKPSFKEKFEFEQLEKEIPSLENEKEEITAKLSTTSDHAELANMSARFAEIEHLLETKTLRWMELSEIVHV